VNEYLDAWGIISGLGAGLALFLYGMERLTGSLNSLAGPELTRMLAAVTNNRLKAATTGAIITAIIQSSSITTVMCVGFISAGLITLKQAVGVILGANVGTTITAQVFAFDITRLAFPLIIVGMLLRLVASRKLVHHLGTVIFGLGLLFFGMVLMSHSTYPLRQHPAFLDLMKSLSHPLLGLLAGAGFTALIQSSSATTGLVIVLAGQGSLTLEAGLALVLGANVGTCFTALLATLGKSRLALQAALVHVVFNLAGALLWLPFLQLLGRWAQAISPVGDLPRQIANAHTLFNLSSAMVFLAITPQVARFVSWLAPETPKTAAELERPLYLDLAYLEIPSLALDQVRLEVTRYGEWVHRQTRKVLTTFVSASLDDFRQLETEIKQGLTLHDSMLSYMARLHQQGLERPLALRLQRDLVIANAYHTVATVLAGEILVQSRGLVEHGGFTLEFLEALEKLGNEAAESLQSSVQAFREDDHLLAASILERKGTIRDLRDLALESAMSDLDQDEKLAIERFRRCAGLVDEWRRIYYFASRVAHTLLRSDPT